MTIASTRERSSVMLDAPADWTMRRLGTFATKVGSGATPRGGKSVYLNSRVSHALIRSQHVFDRRFDSDEIAFISEEHAQELRNAEVRPGDILLNITGDGVTFARACIVPNHVLPAAVNQHVSIVRVDQNVCAPGYLLGYLTHPVTKRYIESFNTGGSRRAITKGHIESFEVPLPPLPVQQRIAGILSAYDELIENNLRRTRILEAMARAFFREWFVNFRFPGHEKRPRVVSPLGDIPQGWEVREMQEVADVIDCLHSKKPTECPDATGIFLQLNNVGEAGKLDMREQFRISAEDYALWTSRIELRAGDCVITNVGRVGAVAQIPDGFSAAPGRNMTAIRPRTGRLTPTYLIEYLLSSHMTSEVAKKKDLGTIMDSLNVKGIIRLHVPCPPMEAMLKFESIARPIRKRVEVLTEQSQNLQRTRDLLLPRLLSGQVDVKEIESSRE